VWLFPVHVSESIVPPHDVAIPNVQRRDKCSLDRDHTSREVDDPTIDDWSTTNRPDGDQPTIPQQHSCAWDGSMLPTQFAAVKIDAIETPIV
jgi:hypothetical protein